MALEKIAGSTGSVANPDKTIAVFDSTTTTMYACPEGRKFTGHVHLSSTTVAVWFKVNGVNVYANPSADSYIPVSLTAGDYINSNNNAITLLGIESDA